MADNADCSGYSGGSLAGAIIGTFAATLLLLGLIYLVWEWQKKRRIKREGGQCSVCSGLHNLVIVEDGGTAEGGDAKGFAYDNPGFMDESSEAKKSQQGGALDAKFNGAGKPVSRQNGGKMPWGPLSFLFKSRNALDDSVVEEPQKYNVALKGHDFTGLGFNICGNMRDGIFVKDIMQRGPAAESNQILLGDQITGMTVSFKQMVLEDALTLLSYASPYEVNLEMLRLPEKSLPHKGIFMSSPAHPSASSGQSNTLERVCHPFFKSQSIDDLRKVGKEHLDLQVDRKKKQANGIHTSKTPSTTTVSSGTMEIPTVVVVGNNENRSSSSSKSKATSSAVKLPKMPKMSFSFGSSSSSNTSPKPKKGPEAHQKASSSQIQIPIPDEVDGAISPVAISVTKPEIIPRTKAKTSNVHKSAPAGDDMELVEAISPAIDKMTADFEKNKKKSMQTIKDGVASSAVLDVQPVEIDMSGQPSVKVESSSGMPMEMTSMKVDMPSADVDVRAPSMVFMSGDGKKKGDTKEKESKKKEKSAGKQKGGSTNIDLTLPSISLKAGGGIEMNEGESGDAQDAKKPQRNQKSKEKTDKSKEKENKKAEKEAKEKESSEQQQQGESSGGEKSKFFKFGIPVLPDISWSFGKSSAATEDKDKDKEDKEKEVKQETTETAASPNKNVSPKKEKGKHKEKSPEPVSPKENSNKDDKKEKETKEKSSKDKNKEKEVKEKETSSKLAQAPVEGEEQPENTKEASSKEKSGSSFSFNIKLPSFDKPLLKRKDSSSSNSGDTTAMAAVDASPNAASSGPSDNADAKSKNDKSATEASPAKSKKKAGKEKKEKVSSRPTSPEVSEGHRTTDDEGEKSGDIVDMPGEKMSKKGGGFHMPHIGIKLPKFGHSKQTYSFENVGDNKDIKHSHGPTAEALLEGNQSMKLEVSANTPEFKSMTPTQDDIVSEVAVKMDQPSMTSMTEASTAIKKATDEVDSAQVKVDIDVPKVTLLTTEIPVASLKVEGAENDGASKAEEKSEIKSSEEETNKKELENKEKEPSPSKEPKPSFVSKGLKGLRDLKDKVAHKLSHDHQQHSSGSSSEDEREPGDEKVTKEKIKKEKKSKESRDKSKEEKQKEKEEKSKEKEKLKAEKKLRKAELKKKSATHSSSSSSSSSSDESDADDGKDKKEKEKKKLKTKEKSQKDKKGKKEKKEKSEKSKSVGIEVKAEMPSVEMQTQDAQLSTSIEQKQMSGHELKLVPAKPPVVPRKSRDTSKDDSVKGAVGGETAGASKAILKKTKSKGGTSTSSSSSSSESDNEGKKDDREGKPKKPKRTPKRKAPEIPSIHATEVPDIVKITTSAEVISPPREESGKNSEMRESSKTPESGRRSASFGDLSSLQQPKMQGDGILERAMSMDIAGDTDKTNEPGVMSVGSSLEDLSAVPDSKMINHLTRGQQQQLQLQGLRDSMTSKASSSSNETLKSTPTAVIQVHPKEQHELPVASLETSQVAPTAKLRVTIAPEPEKDPQSSTVQQMMNETLSVMNNIVHEMDSPSLVKSAMNTSGQSTSDSSKVTISTIGTKLDDKAEAEKVAVQTVDEIMVKASQSLMPEVTATVNTQEEGPKVSVTTGDCNEPSANHNIISDLAHSLSADMEGGADSFSIASVKIQGMDGDNEEPISVRNITVTNIKSEPKPAIVDDDNADDIPNEQTDESANTSSSSDPNKQVKRGDSKARLLQTVADANEIKVAPATPLRKDSSLSSSSCSVDSSPDVKSDAAMMKPNFSFETKPVQDSDTDQKNGKANGQTIEISSAELDGIMMSHADFLQKQAAVVSTSTQDDSLDEPDQLHQKLKDTFDSWVYVEQKNAAHEHTCPHSHSDPEPSTSSSNDDDEGPYSRNGALSPTTYRMETEYKFETSEMRVTSSPIPPEDAHVKSQSTVYSTTMTLPQKTVTQITLGDPVMDTGGRIVSKITLDTSSQGAEDASVKSSADKNAELPKLESLK